ncbi:MAG: hypothetical protein P9L99_20690 [Candidatus Lernaella stagnicola]|nr:hypothetical protein [Candidatus Lernaella stagnicola]
MFEFSEFTVRWFKAYLFTFAIEVPIFIFFARRYAKAWQLAIAGAAGTAYTHPLLWFVWRDVVYSWFFHCGGREIIRSPYTAYLVSGELLVCVLETFTFWAVPRAFGRRIPFSLAVAASFIANAASFGVGQLMNALGWGF